MCVSILNAGILHNMSGVRHSYSFVFVSMKMFVFGAFAELCEVAPAGTHGCAEYLAIRFAHMDYIH